MVKIAFYTITGQTQRFINKTGLDAHRIEDAHPQYQMNDKYGKKDFCYIARTDSLFT